jgi:hypothetical protein
MVHSSCLPKLTESGEALLALKTTARTGAKHGPWIAVTPKISAGTLQTQVPSRRSFRESPALLQGNSDIKYKFRGRHCYTAEPM